uniref:Uncharacterized protein n=1 Tax=Geladintestivirus 2 TaxID=3233134 RepID=A0AAU8MM64_9CAUD
MINLCDNCPVRLFNTKHYNLKPIGNPYHNKAIVVPNVGYEGYKRGSIEFDEQVKLILNHISFTGELHDVYIVPFIRCNTTISCEINDNIIANCSKYFIAEVNKFKFTDIMFLGDSVRMFCNCNITEYLDTIMVSRKGIRLAVNYSPLIKFVDKDKFSVFKDKLNKWYNAVNNKYFDNYNILKL